MGRVAGIERRVGRGRPVEELLAHFDPGEVLGRDFLDRVRNLGRHRPAAVCLCAGRDEQPLEVLGRAVEFQGPVGNDVERVADRFIRCAGRILLDQPIVGAGSASACSPPDVSSTACSSAAGSSSDGPSCADSCPSGCSSGSDSVAGSTSSRSSPGGLASASSSSARSSVAVGSMAESSVAGLPRSSLRWRVLLPSSPAQPAPRSRRPSRRTVR